MPKMAGDPYDLKVFKKENKYIPSSGINECENQFCLCTCRGGYHGHNDEQSRFRKPTTTIIAHDHKTHD